MHQASPLDEAQLRKESDAGDLVASNTLASILYSQRCYEEAAALYLKCLRGDFYKLNSNFDSEMNIKMLLDRNLVSSDSEFVTYVRDQQKVSASFTRHAYKAAGRAGIATFFGYLLLVFGGGVTGVLRDFSLVIAGGLAWVVWKFVISSFESET